MSAVFWDRKGLAKSILDGLLTGLGLLVYHAGLAQPIIHLHRHSPKVLMYHACEEAESDFTRGLAINTTPSQFASHLQFLSRYYRMIPLAELMRGSPPESRSRSPLMTDSGPFTSKPGRSCGHLVFLRRAT